MKTNAKTGSFLQRGLSLQLLVLIILPLTVLLVVIAIGSVALHQQAMRASLPENAQSAADTALELTLVAPLALIAPLLFALAALWFGARQIVQPLQRLESKAAAVASGDYDTIQQPVGGIPEVQHLQSELAEMARKVRASQEGLHDYIGAITSAQEEERLRIARELHDDTIQELIALKQRMQLAEKAAKDPGAVQLLGDLQQLAEGTIQNVRRLTRALRPIYLEDLGLVTALEMLAHETSQPGGLRVDFERSGPERRLPQEAELALFRIAQQALSNVVRHAQARQASLQIAFDDREINLMVSDDGVGFEQPRTPTDFASHGHFGLLGMRERADLIGAALDVRSHPGSGTRLAVRLPLARLEQERATA
jgi:signal transduction histidine kinase